MVKAIIYTVTAIALSLGLFIFAEIYTGKQFEEFSTALNTLYAKTENKTATREDRFGQTKKVSCTSSSRTTIFLI